MFPRVSESPMVKPTKDYNHYITKNLFFLLIMRSEDSLEYTFVCSAVFSEALLPPLHWSLGINTIYPPQWLAPLTHEKLHGTLQSAFHYTKENITFTFFRSRTNFYFHFLWYFVKQNIIKTTTSILISSQFGSRSNKSQKQKKIQTCRLCFKLCLLFIH